MSDTSLHSGQALPTGTVTFLFTDIEGSTRLLQQMGDRYADVLSDQQRLLRAALKERGGYEVDTQGDAFFVAFSRAKDALMAAIKAQQSITRHSWPGGVSVSVRMGLHTGEPIRTEMGYVGMDVNRAARICSAGHGGQILLSQTTRDLVEHDLSEGISLRALGEHRLKDLQYPEQIFQLLHPDLPSDFPPLKSLDNLPNNLPVQLTSFVGREREMSEVKRLLAATRLLTLTGSGGCGKTRLALQVGAELADEFKDGVWLVELASLSDPGLVPQAVASVLGVREELGHLPMGQVGPGAIPGTSGGRSILSKLIDYLRPKQMMLILDNCEHLITACAKLIDTLLHACPKLKILAASREALGIVGETAWRVPSLSLPEPKRLGPVEASALTQYEAVRLFIDRALAVQPTFAVTNRNAPAVAQICHRLDGIPLAIELAAARVKVLSAEQIAKRLDDLFRLLTGGGRTALPRQQTLRATIDWSYNLLSEEERMLFRRLSVFMGGWTIEAAEAICADTLPPAPRGRGTGGRKRAEARVPSVRSDDVLDLLTHLVDKSLAVVEEERGEARYRLLETIRQYARDKLLESGDAVALRWRHLEWFLELAEKAEPEFRGPNQVVWLDRLEAEHDNLRAALEWSLGSGEAETGLRLAGALLLFWIVRGYLSEGREWMVRALSVSSGASASARAKALNGAGYITAAQGNVDQGTAMLEESRTLFREAGDKKGIGWSQEGLGIVALLFQGDYERAKALFEDNLALYREMGNKGGMGRSLEHLGYVMFSQGDYERAKALWEESLPLAREVGDKRHIAFPLNFLGNIMCSQGDYRRAEELIEEGLALFREIGEKWAITLLLRSLAAVALHQGNYSRTTTLLEESLTLCRELGLRPVIAQCLEGFAEVAEAQGQLERATRLFGAAEALREAISVPIWPSERADYDRSVAAIRSALGEERLAKAWAEGRKMTMEEAIQLAVGGGQ